MNTYPLPVALDFDVNGGVKLGRGQAGWTVKTFDTAEERADFMSANSFCSLPCWKRIAVQS